MNLTENKKISGASSSSLPLKILVIDDDPKISWIITDALNVDNQYKVISAENGKEGLDLIHQETPDIILLDIVMPVMDGLTLLKKVKSLNISSEIVMISGKNDRKTVVEAIRMGATDFISKPVGLEDLSILLAKMLRK